MSPEYQVESERLSFVKRNKKGEVRIILSTPEKVSNFHSMVGLQVKISHFRTTNQIMVSTNWLQKRNHEVLMINDYKFCL